MARRNAMWKLTSRSNGAFSEGDYTMEEAEVPTIGPGEICVRVVYVSCDPTQIIWSRVDSYMPKVALGEVMTAGAVGVVEESSNDGFSKGDRVSGMFNFQKYWQGDPAAGLMPVSKLADGLDFTAAMCLFNHIGLTATRLITIGKPKEGETVVVTGAAGAVGLLVCQMAKAAGCRVVATAGTEKKLAYLRDECGVDVAVNYKQDGLRAALEEACPRGIDIYWENVGGKTTEAAWPLLNRYARVICCGMISMYTTPPEDGAPENALGVGIPLYGTDIVTKEIKIEGFICTSNPEDHPMMISKLAEFAASGKLKPRLDVVNGFENTIKALGGLYTGENMGKRVVQYSEL